MTVHSYTVMQISVGVAPAATLYEQSNNCTRQKAAKWGRQAFFQFYVICAAAAYFYAD